jgi:glycosyltransferase involved in cell wall biosynthesis
MNLMTKPILLYIITKSDLGGAQENALLLIKAFYKKYEVHLAVGDWGPLADRVKALGIPVHLIPNLVRSINLLSDLRAIRECLVLLKTIQPDIIHTHSSKAGVIGRLAGYFGKVPTVFTAHGWGFTPGAPRIRRFIAFWAEKLLAQITCKIICVCEYDRQMALRLGVGNQSSLVTIRCGIPNVSNPLAESSRQPPRAIMVARFNEQKDQVTFLKAIAQLSDPDLHVDFVASGPTLETCKALVQSLGIADRVSFLGDRRDVSYLLAQSQIFVLSTHYEGLPISILEAMRAGLPVVATHVNGVPEQVIHDQTGFLVPRSDEQALAQALQILIKAPELRQKMGAAGRQKYLKEFTIEQMISATEHVYIQILNMESLNDNNHRNMKRRFFTYPDQKSWSNR